MLFFRFRDSQKTIKNRCQNALEKNIEKKFPKIDFGFRFGVPKPPQIDPTSNKNRKKKLSKKLGLKNDKIENYYHHSHKLGIVPKNLNKLKNKLFGIECNFEELNGIDFKKGCYVGQENTARIKLKNKLSKRLLPIEIIDGSLSEDETIFFKDIEIGKVLIANDYPFALIKYQDKNFEENIKYKTKDASIVIKIPDWIRN